MAKHLTDRQKKKIIADYAELGNYSQVAKKHKVSFDTVKRVVLRDPETLKKTEQKKEQNTADILAHMETKKNAVNQIIDRYLLALLDEEKIEKATPAQLTTALGTLIDKFTSHSMGSTVSADMAEDNKMLKTLFGRDKDVE
jgi:chromatin segregation and condensation protein Rec8/ScpA/Scc1 (kleisin family)